MADLAATPVIAAGCGPGAPVPVRSRLPGLDAFPGNPHTPSLG